MIALGVLVALLLLAAVVDHRPPRVTSSACTNYLPSIMRGSSND